MKKILLLLLLLTAVNAMGADSFLNDFSDYRYRIKEALGLDTSSTSVLDTTLNSNVRISVYDIYNELPFRTREFKFVTTKWITRYALDTGIVDIVSVEWFSDNGDTTKTLFYVPREEWYTLSIKRTSDESDAYSRRPSWYDYNDSLIFIYPSPVIAGDSIKILASHKLPDFISKDTLEMVPLNYRVTVLKYATYITARSRQHPLTTVFYQEYQAALAALKRKYGRTIEKISDK